VQEAVSPISEVTGSSATLRHARRLTQRIGSDLRFAYSFMLVHVKNLHAYTMYARTEEDKNKWLSAIREALGNINPQRMQPMNNLSTHEVHMNTFEQPTSCEHCHKLLKGLFYQGYRCEKCGCSLHKDCISLLPKCRLQSTTATAVPPRLPLRPLSMQLPVQIDGGAGGDRKEITTFLVNGNFTNCKDHSFNNTAQIQRGHQIYSVCT
jgi:hypothetical protein